MAALSVLIKGIFESKVIWLCLVLALIDISIQWLRPLKYVADTPYISLDKNPVLYKIPEYFSSHNKPDVLLLGSSLPMTAVAHWDARYAHSIDSNRLESVRAYTQACYLQDKLSEILNRKVSVFNLTCLACMASEAHLLLRHSIASGHRPCMLLYAIAPRDFVDNTVGEIGKTPVFKMLQGWQYLQAFLMKRSALNDFVDSALSCTWYLYRVRADYRTFLIALVSDTLNTSLALYTSMSQNNIAQVTNTSQPSSKQSQANSTMCCLADLKEYEERYNPPNFNRLQMELDELNHMARLCKTESIRLIVINMPLTLQNRALLDKTLHDRYLRSVSHITSVNGATFIDIDANRFGLNDFSDSVHLNANGGKKMQDILITAMKCTKQNKISLRKDHSRILAQ